MRNQKYKVNKFVSLIFIVVICYLLFGIATAGAVGVADPLHIGVGARSMGMGKAYVGLAEDGDALFLNPAGIAKASSFKFSSMYSNLLNDVQYTVVSGVAPRDEQSAFGVGYVGYQVGDITLRSLSGTSEGTASFGSNVIFISYGTYLSKFLSQAWGKDVLLGGNLKYFSSGAAGDLSSSDTAIDVDLALLVPVNTYTDLGINAQNVLSTTMARSGDEIAAVYKVGFKATLLGRKEKAWVANDYQTLNIVCDIDFEKNGSVAHAGAEFWPTQNFALRLGSDAADFTAGAGLRLAGIQFDYAYHSYANIPENVTHYVSLSYVGPSRKLRICLDSPMDKVKVHEEFVEFRGKIIVENSKPEEKELPVTLKINEIEVPLAEDFSFSVEIPLKKYGRNVISIVAESDSIKETQKIKLVRLD